jgi:pyridinium-3,5-bisthiocarboxylic acid mononucleotide nickel chelatase
VAKEQARFHEIGALDALADIAGACAARHCLGIERVLSRPVSVGGGYVASAHGLLAVPGPAALEILRSHEIPWKGGPVDEELLTPTGAALLATLVDEFVPEFPLIQATRVGYGAGKRELTLPNVLRSVVARILPESQTKDAQNHGSHGDRIVQLETNVDDVTGEVLGHLIELLMQAGALDVSVLPALMKKGRAGFVIRAIARHEEMELLAKVMIRETGSLGVRIFPSIHRLVAEREQRDVQVDICGQVYTAQVKVSRMDGELLSIKPEYEDCRRIACETDQPLRMVIKKVEEAGWQGAAL